MGVFFKIDFKGIYAYHNCMKKINLSGEWQFKETAGEQFYKAAVPGCNYLDLEKNNIIPSPYFKDNENKVQYVGEKDWIYQKQFYIEKDIFLEKEIWLVCHGLDCITEIYINGEKAGQTKNAFIGHEFEVKKLLKIGNNTIQILFFSPVNYVNKAQKKESCPKNANGLNGIPHIRKPQYHFGWDWGPSLPLSGITDDIFLLGESIGIINKPLIKQRHLEGNVELTVSGDIKNICNKALNLTVTLISPDGLREEKQITANDNYNAVFNIENPILWWTKELSGKERQSLYTITIDGNGVEPVTSKIGLRTIHLDRAKDENGENFKFVLNGVPIFAKGANYIPLDNFITEVGDQRMENMVKSAVSSNFNMLRIWGGGYYGTEKFYSLCDEYGLLVWQDFCFACQPYPFFDEKFLKNVTGEIEYIVRLLSSHPSLCLWCGNNEIELMSVAWKNRLKYIRWTEKFFYHILPNIIRKFDLDTPYIAGTPIGRAHNKKVNDDAVGDTHLWAVWHGLQPLDYYRKRYTRFCSEFGFESMPDTGCVMKFAETKDMHLDSKVMKAHQKCKDGNNKMTYYIASRFRLPKDFDDYVYLSQICQSECIKDAAEHWRRNKGVCNGALYWQYGDCWPCCSWSSIDYYGNNKALQYQAKNFYNPLLISLENGKTDVKVFAVNDTLHHKDAEILINSFSFDGKIKKQLLKTKICLEKHSSKLVAVIPYNEICGNRALKNTVLAADLIIDGKSYNRKTLLFDKEKNIKFPIPKIEIKIKNENGRAKYILKSSNYVRYLRLFSSGGEKFEDNYFDLLPGEEYIIFGKNEFLPGSRIEAKSIADIVPKYSRFYDSLIKFFVLIKPVNFFSYLYYKFLQ